MGRTVAKFGRAYIDGIDVSGNTRSFGPLVHEYEEAVGTAINDEIVGVLPNQATIAAGTLTGNFDNTVVTGLHTLLNAPGQVRDVMFAIGFGAAPAEGDPAFCAQLEQKSYSGIPTAGELVTSTIIFDNWSQLATTLSYDRPWGLLAHELSAEVAVNSGTAVIDHGAATAKGGFMMYHATSGVGGNVTIKIQDADTNSDGSFGDLLTSGVIDPSSAPVSGLVALAVGATVEKFIRWQVVFDVGSSVTFALAFVRGNRL